MNVFLLRGKLSFMYLELPTHTHSSLQSPCHEEIMGHFNAYLPYSAPCTFLLSSETACHINGPLGKCRRQEVEEDTARTLHD